MGFVGDILGLDTRETTDPATLAQENLLTQITPTGTSRVGSIGRGGEFLPAERVPAIKFEESPFAQQLRSGQEQLQLGLLGQTGLPGITPRTAQDIRARIPSAQGTLRGLQGVRTAGAIEQGLSPFVGTEDFGSEIGRLEEATFESVASRLRPEFQRAEQQLVQTLADRGIPLESRAGQIELEGLREQQSDAFTQAGFRATAAGRGEQERLARLGLSTRGQQAEEGLRFAGLETGARQLGFFEQRQQLQDALNKQIQLSELESRQRAAQLGELGGLLNLGTPFQGGIFQTGAGTTGEALKASQRQGRGEALSSLFSLGGAAIGSRGGGGLPSAGASGIPAAGFAAATGIPFAG